MKLTLVNAVVVVLLILLALLIVFVAISLVDMQEAASKVDERTLERINKFPDKGWFLEVVVFEGVDLSFAEQVLSGYGEVTRRGMGTNGFYVRTPDGASTWGILYLQFVKSAGIKTLPSTTSRARDINFVQCHTNGQTILQLWSVGDWTTPSGTVFEIYSLNDGVEVNTNITVTITVDLEKGQEGNFTTSAPLSPDGSYFLNRIQYPYAYFEC